METVKVDGFGGKFVFPDGTSAEMRSVTSRHMNVGDEYLLFLKRNKPPSVDYSPLRPDSDYNIVGLSEGAIKLNWKDSTTEPLSVADGSPHLLNEEVANVSPSSLIQKVIAALPATK